MAAAALALIVALFFFVPPLESWVSAPPPAAPRAPQLWRGAPGVAKPIPSQDFMPPPLPPRPRPVLPPGEVPDYYVRPPGV